MPRLIRLAKDLALPLDRGRHLPAEGLEVDLGERLRRPQRAKADDPKALRARVSQRITEAGLAALGSYEPLPTGQALLEHWLRELGESGAARMLRELGESGAARMLRALATVYPGALTLKELGDAAEISSESGTFSTYLSRLRTLELVHGRGQVKASEELFS